MEKSSSEYSVTVLRLRRMPRLSCKIVGERCKKRVGFMEQSDFVYSINRSCILCLQNALVLPVI